MGLAGVECMAFAHIGVANVEKRISSSDFHTRPFRAFSSHRFLRVGFEGSAVSGRDCWLVAAVRKPQMGKQHRGRREEGKGERKDVNRVEQTFQGILSSAPFEFESRPVVLSDL